MQVRENSIGRIALLRRCSRATSDNSPALPMRQQCAQDWHILWRWGSNAEIARVAGSSQETWHTKRLHQIFFRARRQTTRAP